MCHEICYIEFGTCWGHRPRMNFILNKLKLGKGEIKYKCTWVVNLDRRSNTKGQYQLLLSHSNPHKAVKF